MYEKDFFSTKCTCLLFDPRYFVDNCLDNLRSNKNGLDLKISSISGSFNFVYILRSL